MVIYFSNVPPLTRNGRPGDLRCRTTCLAARHGRRVLPALSRYGANRGPHPPSSFFPFGRTTRSKPQSSKDKQEQVPPVLVKLFWLPAPPRKKLDGGGAAVNSIQGAGAYLGKSKAGDRLGRAWRIEATTVSAGSAGAGTLSKKARGGGVRVWALVKPTTGTVRW